MTTQKQRLALALVVAFGLGVLITLECVEADARDRIAAAQRASLDCRDRIVVAVPNPQWKTGGGL